MRKEQGTWNRAARRSGGARLTEMVLPRIMTADLIILAQRERIRKEFGEKGVARFDAALLANAQEDREGTP